MQSVRFAKNLVVTPELRKKYAPRLRLLRKKREVFLQALKDMQAEEEIVKNMCLLSDVGRVIEPGSTNKQQNKIYQCIRKAAARGQIRSETIEQAVYPVNVRKRVYVHIEDARFYFYLSTGQKREMGTREYSLDEMRKRVQE